MSISSRKVDLQVLLSIHKEQGPRPLHLQITCLRSGSNNERSQTIRLLHRVGHGLFHTRAVSIPCPTRNGYHVRPWDHVSSVDCGMGAVTCRWPMDPQACLRDMTHFTCQLQCAPSHPEPAVPSIMSLVKSASGTDHTIQTRKSWLNLQLIRRKWPNKIWEWVA